jgi:hypothetical protein
MDQDANFPESPGPRERSWQLGRSGTGRSGKDETFNINGPLSRDTFSASDNPHRSRIRHCLRLLSLRRGNPVTAFTYSPEFMLFCLHESPCAHGRPWSPSPRDPARKSSRGRFLRGWRSADLLRHACGAVRRVYCGGMGLLPYAQSCPFDFDAGGGNMGTLTTFP